MPTDSPPTLSAPGQPDPVSRSGRQTRLPSLYQSNSPRRPGGLEERGRPSVPQQLTRTGCNSKDVAVLAYLPARLVAAAKPVVALCPQKVHAAEPGAAPRPGPRDPEAKQPQAARRAEFHGPTLRMHPFTSGRFHVLLNSLFKVLFNFPSRYLSAIGLVPVFSLRWSLPPALGCIPKQPDS